MPLFTKGPALRTPFGKNVYLRSTRDFKTISAMVAASTVPAITIDGATDQKVLQPGVVIAKIVSGAEIGKFGPFQPGGSLVNESASIAVDATGGTFTITWDGSTTAAIAFNATAAAVKAALLLADNDIGADDIIVTGGPGVAGGATPYLITWTGDYGRRDVTAVTTTAASLTGGAGTAAVTTIAGGSGSSGGATDGRENPDNIVGLNNTFLPWQLMEGDREVAVVYEAAVTQANCLVLNAAGTAFIPMNDAVASAMGRTKAVSILFP